MISETNDKPNAEKAKPPFGRFLRYPIVTAEQANAMRSGNETKRDVWPLFLFAHVRSRIEWWAKRQDIPLADVDFYDSTAKISAALDMDRRVVGAHLQTLVAAGWLVQSGTYATRNGNINKYKLTAAGLELCKAAFLPVPRILVRLSRASNRKKSTVRLAKESIYSLTGIELLTFGAILKHSGYLSSNENKHGRCRLTCAELAKVIRPGRASLKPNVVYAIGSLVAKGLIKRIAASDTDEDKRTGYVPTIPFPPVACLQGEKASVACLPNVGSLPVDDGSLSAAPGCLSANVGSLPLPNTDTDLNAFRPEGDPNQTPPLAAGGISLSDQSGIVPTPDQKQENMNNHNQNTVQPKGTSPLPSPQERSELVAISRELVDERLVQAMSLSPVPDLTTVATLKLAVRRKSPAIPNGQNEFTLFEFLVNEGFDCYRSSLTKKVDSPVGALRWRIKNKFGEQGEAFDKLLFKSQERADIERWFGTLRDEMDIAQRYMHPRQDENLLRNAGQKPVWLPCSCCGEQHRNQRHKTGLQNWMFLDEFRWTVNDDPQPVCPACLNKTKQQLVDWQKQNSQQVAAIA